MPLSGRTSCFVVLASVLAACSDSTAPSLPRATVTVPAQSLAVTTVAAGSVTWIEFTVPLRIDNGGSSPLTFQLCASRVEAQASDAWAAAWTPVCVADGAAPVVVPAGNRRDVTVSVRAAIQGPGGPAWVPGSTAGSYRFAAGLLGVGASGAIPVVASNAFTLVGGP
jgi:hypothetical protein